MIPQRANAKDKLPPKKHTQKQHKTKRHTKLVTPTTSLRSLHTHFSLSLTLSLSLFRFLFVFSFLIFTGTRGRIACGGFRRRRHPWARRCYVEGAPPSAPSFSLVAWVDSASHSPPSCPRRLSEDPPPPWPAPRTSPDPDQRCRGAPRR